MQRVNNTQKLRHNANEYSERNFFNLNCNKKYTILVQNKAVKLSFGS